MYKSVPLQFCLGAMLTIPPYVIISSRECSELSGYPAEYHTDPLYHAKQIGCARGDQLYLAIQ